MKSLFIVLSLFSLIFCCAEEKYRIDFAKASVGKDLPDEWETRGKPFTPSPEFSICTDPATRYQVLHVHSEKASGVIMRKLPEILKEYPVMRWRWRMLKYPKGADAKDPEKDDQGIAVYVGFGRIGSKSVAYHWETETQKGESGTATCGGLVEVKWFALRNKMDGTGIWFEEERNVYQDLMAAYGKVPDALAISISSNSQYTGTDCIAELEYIEFVKAAEK